MKAQIERLIDSGCRRIVLNMSEVSYIDSCGMGFIVCAVRRMKTLGGLMSLTNVQPTAFKALVRMGLIDFMPISTCAAKSRVTPLAPGTHPSFQTTFRVDPNKMCDARSRAIALLKTLPFTSDQKFDIELAVGEAIGNAVDHACEKGVLTTVSAYPDRVVIDVSDCGGGFSISDEEEPPETGQFAERGRGVKLMRLLMDAVSIQEKPSGNGTVPAVYSERIRMAKRAVMNGCGRDQVARADVPLEHLHDLHAGLLGHADALGIDRGNGAVAGKRDAQGLGEALDGISGEHARAAAAGGAGGVLEVIHLLLGHGAGGDLACGIEQGIQVGLASVPVVAGEHRAARDHDGGDVDAAGRDEHAGDHLVAGRDDDHAVEGVPVHDALNAVGDDLAAREGVLHAFVVHRDAVAYADRGGLQRRAACHADARLHGFGDGVEMQVAGDYFVLGRDDGDERTLQLFVGESVGLEKAAVRRARHALLYRVASKPADGSRS